MKILLLRQRLRLSKNLWLMYLIISKHGVVSTDKLHLLLWHHGHLIHLLCRWRRLTITTWLLLHSLVKLLLMIRHSISKIAEGLWLRQRLYQILWTSDKDRWTMLRMELSIYRWRRSQLLRTQRAYFVLKEHLVLIDDWDRSLSGRNKKLLIPRWRIHIELLLSSLENRCATNNWGLLFHNKNLWVAQLLKLNLLSHTTIRTDSWINTVIYIN